MLPVTHRIVGRHINEARCHFEGNHGVIKVAGAQTKLIAAGETAATERRWGGDEKLYRAKDCS